MNFCLVLSCLLFSYSEDSTYNSILKRIHIRDSTTNAIIAVNFPSGVAGDVCDAPYMDFSISMKDSQTFSVTLSPMYSGSAGGCFPSNLFENYLFKYTSQINEEYLKYKKYVDMDFNDHEKKRKEFERKIFKLTNCFFNYHTSICTILDSLGENCTVSCFSTCDTIIGLIQSGFALRYQKFTLTFRCNRGYCFLKNIFTNDEFKNDNSCLTIEQKIPPNIAIIKENCNSIYKKHITKKK